MHKYIKYNNNRFNKWAKYYDLTWVPLFFLRKQIIKNIPKISSGRALDLCTGTGDLALAMAINGEEVIGVDLSEDILAIARKKNSYQNLKFDIQDASDLKFEDNYFDLITISFGLHEMPLDIAEQAISEIYRVLKPDGKVMIVDFCKSNKLFYKLAMPFIKQFECKYYYNFINFDLEKVLIDNRFHIMKSQLVLGGSAKIIKLKKEIK